MSLKDIIYQTQMFQTVNIEKILDGGRGLCIFLQLDSISKLFFPVCFSYTSYYMFTFLFILSLLLYALFLFSFFFSSFLLLHFLCAGAMLIFSVSFQFQYMLNKSTMRGSPICYLYPIFPHDPEITPIEARFFLRISDS